MHVKNITCVTYITLLFLFFVGATVSLAQQGEHGAYSISLDEEYPSPGSFVTASLRSGGSSVANIRSVRWYINGDEQEQYANKLQLDMPTDSSPKHIVANIVYFNAFDQRRSLQVTKWVRPIVFDLLWEGDAVTTPQYRGHRLVSPETPIKISAKIHFIDQNGTTYTEDDFSFRWEVKSEFLEDRGPGVSSVVYGKGARHVGESVFVRVEATLINRNDVLLERVLFVPITEPRVLVYPSTLLHGLSDNAAASKNVTLSDDKPATFSVYPFYFSKGDFEKNAIQYKWFVNNNQNHLKEGRKIDISADGQEDVTIPLRIQAENENRKNQKAHYTFAVVL